MADLPVITIEQLATKKYSRFLGFDAAAVHTGISVAELRKARAAGSLEPDASLRTGQRGRPALLFTKGTLTDFARRYNAARKAPAAPAAEQVEAPVETTDEG